MEENNVLRFAYVGSFDPWTKGHQSVAEKFLKKHPDLKLEIILGVNPKKEYTFKPFERALFIERGLELYKGRFDISFTKEPVSDYLYEKNIPFIIKGIRNARDAEYESEMAEINASLVGEPITLLVPQTDPELNKVSSSNLKMLSHFGLSTERYASSLVREALKLRISDRLFVGVCGGIGTGKSTLCKALAERNKEIKHINMDGYGKTILNSTDDVPEFAKKVRLELDDLFGNELMNKDGTIDRKRLGDIVFEEKRKLDLLTELMLEPILYLMYKDIKTIGSGIVLIESAILIERGLTELVDDNVVLVNVPKKEQVRRLRERGLSDEQIGKRLDSQATYEDNLMKIQYLQSKEHHRIFLDVESGDKHYLPNIESYLLREYDKRRQMIY